ncbi:MAG TPA: SpoIIE family protein phosphatase [Anaerolineae bacterium]|nr:SpoIIE family protein phosphatase [Anaerolineae bacterium]
MVAKLSGRLWRRRLVIALLLLTAAILVIISGYSYWTYQEATADLVIETDRQLAFVSAARLREELTKFADELLLVARVPGIRAENEATAALQQARHRLSIFDGGVVLLDNFGRVRAAEPERGEILGADWSERDFFRALLNSSRAYFSNITGVGPNGAEVVVVSVPILGENQEFVGALVGMFRVGESGVSPLYASVVRLRIGQTGSTYILDSDGRILYDSEQVRVGDRLLLSGQQDEDVRGAAQRMLDPDGNDVISASATVPGTRWKLVIEDNWATVTSKTQNYARNLLLILAAGIVLPTLGMTALIRNQSAERLERERSEQEVRVAGLIQQRVLPRALPMLPGWSLAVYHKQVDTPGQDFYDALLLEDGQLMLVVGHVTEQGLTAAHILSTTRAALRGATHLKLSPAEALHYGNSLLCPEMQMDRCVTLVYALLDAWGGRLRLANAGFNPPWLDDGDRVGDRQITGSPLGVAPDAVFHEAQVFVQPGHCVVFYSDGLVNACDAVGEAFGLSRLQALVDENNCDAEAIVEAMEGALRRFQEKGGVLPDDVTLLVLQHLADEALTVSGAGRSQRVEFSAPEFDVD